MNNKGFTLVEVLINSSITTIAVLAFGALFIDGIKINRITELRTAMDTSVTEVLQAQNTRNLDLTSTALKPGDFFIVEEVKKVLAQDGISNELIQKCFRKTLNTFEISCSDLGKDWRSLNTTINKSPYFVCLDVLNRKPSDLNKCLFTVETKFKLNCTDFACDQIFFNVNRSLNEPVVKQNHLIEQVKNLRPNLDTSTVHNLVQSFADLDTQYFSCNDTDQNYVLTQFDFSSGKNSCRKCEKNCGEIRTYEDTPESERKVEFKPDKKIYCIPNENNLYFQKYQNIKINYSNLVSPSGNEAWEKIEFICNGKNITQQLFKENHLDIEHLNESGEISFDTSWINTSATANDSGIGLHCLLKVQNHYDEMQTFAEGKLPICANADTDPLANPGSEGLLASGFFAPLESNSSKGNQQYTAFAYPSCNL
jgi:hypothetical protein